MTSTKIDQPADFPLFRRAERALWEHYQLDPEARLVSLGNEKVVRVHEVGDGEHVLFVHGTGGSGVYFAPLVRELASAFRCVLIDRPGWTLSSPVDYAAGDFGTIVADFQDNLLSTLGIDRTHLVGGSIGNLFALRLALNSPERVGNIVLLGGLPAQGLIPPTFLRILRTPLGRIITRMPQKPPMIRKQLAGLGHAKSLAQDRIPHQYIEMKAAESKYTDALKNERELVRSVLARQGFKPGVLLTRQDLAAISAPTLMIYGSDDPLGSEGLWSAFTANMPNATLHITPDSGHLTWFDRPEDVGAHTLEHLQTPPATSR